MIIQKLLQLQSEKHDELSKAEAHDKSFTDPDQEGADEAGVAVSIIREELDDIATLMAVIDGDSPQTEKTTTVFNVASGTTSSRVLAICNEYLSTVPSE